MKTTANGVYAVRGLLMSPTGDVLSGARVGLVDRKSGQVLAEVFSGPDGVYQLSVSVDDHAASFAAPNRLGLVVSGANGKPVARRSNLSRRLDLIHRVDIKAAKSYFRNFAPLRTYAPQLSGGVLDPESLRLLEQGLDRIAKPGSPERATLAKALQCVRPPLGEFDTLLDMA